MVQVDNGLFCGDLTDTAKFKGAIINVLETMPSTPCLWVPLLQFNSQGTVIAPIGKLDLLCELIDARLLVGHVLVHCAAGLERSPLVCAWWLHTRKLMTLSEAYERISREESRVRDSRHWIAK